MGTIFLPGIWPSANTVQKVSVFFVDIGEPGRQLYYNTHAFIFCIILFLSLYAWFADWSAHQKNEPSVIRRILISDYAFLIFVFIFILSARIPLASNGILNPDEPYWVAEAKTLLHDLRPWVSVDTGTGGPIVPLTLLSLKLFGLPIDQGSIKILGGAIIALSTVFVFLGLAHVMGSALSKLFILPLAVAFSAMKSNDLTAYNSEHSVILLISISFFFFCRLYVHGRGWYSINLSMLGFLLGLVPYAKLQGVPIALFIGLAAFLIVYKRLPMRQLFILVSCALLPTLLLLLALLAYGGLHDFWISYFEYNLHYSSQIVIQGGIGSRIKLFLDLLFLAPELHFYIYLTCTVIFAGSLLILFLLNKINKTGKIEILFTLLLMSISVFSIVVPGRLFLHYILLFLVPITILSASFAHVVLSVKTHFFLAHKKILKASRILMLVFFLGAIGFFYFTNIGANKIDYLEKAREHYDGFAPQGLIGAVLDHYFFKGARIAVWEYEPELFEGNDFLIGTRDVATAFHLQTSELQSYYANRYLNDLKLNEPELFIESVTRSTHGVKFYPDIKKYIDENYTMDATIDGYKIYVRKVKIATHRFWKVESKAIKSNITEFHSDLQTLKRNGSFLYFRGWTVLREDVIDQKVFLGLISKRDTLVIPSHQIANSAVVEFSGKKNYRMCGFLGFLPINEIPKGEFQVGLLVENKNDIGFKLTSRKLNRDSLLQD